MPEQDGGTPIDPVAAFRNLQEWHGHEMSRLAGELATQRTYVQALEAEINACHERITALEQNQAPEGPRKSGADLKTVEMQPKSPLKKLGGDA